MKYYDLAIIGSGPGGYIAGLYASRHKLKTCVIEKDLVGGICLNKGCVPTKSLINSASLFSTLKSASSLGIVCDNLRVDFHKMSSRKDEVVARLRTGVETLLRANKIDLIKGTASFSNAGTIKVAGSEDISAKYFIIASGSTHAKLPKFEIDESHILSSEGILSLKEIPKSLLVIGGGVIGCEFTSLYNSLGSKVTIIEFMDRLIPSQSHEISKKLEQIFKKNGIDVLVSTKAEDKIVNAEKTLISAGRVPNISGLGLENAGIGTKDARIEVNDFLQTSVKNIYAIGDCVGGPLLAHKASYDAIIACDNITGKKIKVDYSNIPNLIWTAPEIASVGMNEEDARARYPDLKIAKFPYLASGKAFLMGHTEGYVKIMGNSQGVIAGVEILGHGACDLISEAVMARSVGMKVDEWARITHGHPTLSEMLQEACHIFCGKPIHSI